MTPATPSSFGVKNLGSAIEVELSVLNPHFAELQLRTSTISLSGIESWGKEAALVKVPIFSKQSLNQDIEVTLDTPSLIGTFSPTSEDLADDKEVSLSFITIIGTKK